MPLLVSNTMIEEKRRRWETELLICPECSSSLNTNRMEFIQEEVSERDIYCSNSDCEFEAREQWVLSETLEE